VEYGYCPDVGYAFLPERSKGFDSSSNVFVLVGSNPTGCILFCTVLADAPLILVPYSTATALWPMMHSPYHAHMHVRIRYMRILLEVLISNINDQ
jgi:hypothetical protein